MRARQHNIYLPSTNFFPAHLSYSRRYIERRPSRVLLLTCRHAHFCFSNFILSPPRIRRQKVIYTADRILLYFVSREKPKTMRRGGWKINNKKKGEKLSLSLWYTCFFNGQLNCTLDVRRENRGWRGEGKNCIGLLSQSRSRVILLPGQEPNLLPPPPPN